MKIARCTLPVQFAIGMGAPSAIHGLKITPAIRNMIAQMGVSEAEWIASARRRARNGQDEILGSLGRKSIERTVGEEREIGMPSGFRNV
jgi:hypothetical protein